MSTSAESTKTLVDGLAQPVGAAVARLAGELGAHLHGVVAYGSAVGGEWRAGTSDVNLLVVLERVRAADLATVGRWARAVRALPLSPVVVARYELPALAASQPAALWDLRDRHIVLHGADPLAELALDAVALRAQLRFELRDKLARLRAGYLAQGASVGLALAAFASLLHLCRALLRLVDVTVEPRAVAVMAEAARRLSLDLRLLQTLHGWRNGAERPDPARLPATIEGLMLVYEQAALWLEALPTAKPAKATGRTSRKTQPPAAPVTPATPADAPEPPATTEATPTAEGP
jgi:hypothetical protein